MQQTKRHHFVPRAYLKAFGDDKGRLRIYRKDDVKNPLHLSPDATQFRTYYYSQPTPEGGRDNNRLEQLFSTVEAGWPKTVSMIHGREDVNGRIENILNFMALQRVRVPAARDFSEAALARSVKDTMKLMLDNGELPPPPASLGDVMSKVDVSIDPHKSIHSMIPMLNGMATLISHLGFGFIHNKTSLPFLTSDNPVVYFDPSLGFAEQRPYTTNSDKGPVFLVMPISPKVVLVGSDSYAANYKQHGFLHSDTTDQDWVEGINAQICRYAYESVIAQSLGQEELIEAFADVSPVHEAVTIPTARGLATMHRHTFGPRVAKKKWASDVASGHK